MKGDLARLAARGQRFKDISYFDFWSTRGTYMKIWKSKLDEFLQEMEHSFAV
jgi:hypothetical protein